MREHQALEHRIEGLRRAKNEQELAKKRREAEQKRRMQALYATNSGGSSDPSRGQVDLSSRGGTVNVARLPSLLKKDVATNVPKEYTAVNPAQEAREKRKAQLMMVQQWQA